MSDQPRYLIVNADDFGQTAAITRGIVECHQKGIVTSTSLMVTGRGLAEAVAMSRDNPKLAIGLHFDVWGEDEREFDITDLPATRAEFFRQYEQFIDVMGRKPTHIDSHRHAHRAEHLFRHFIEWTAPLGHPVRDDGKVRFVGDFYAQWEWRVTELKYVSVPFLHETLQRKTPPGFTEFSCHPGWITPDYPGDVYVHEREAEIATLTDPRIRQTIEEEGIVLISYADYNALAAAREATPASDRAGQGRST